MSIFFILLWWLTLILTASITEKEGGVYNRATLRRYLPCLYDYELDLAIATGERTDWSASDLNRKKFVFGALIFFLFFFVFFFFWNGE
jgi:hypothetical protein